MIPTINNSQSSPTSPSRINVSSTTQIPLDNHIPQIHPVNDYNIIPKIDSNLIFQSKNLSSSNACLKSTYSFNKTPSSEFQLNSFSNDSSYTKDNGSLEEFKSKQKLSKDHIYPPEVNIDNYFEDFYRREIEVSHTATKEECISILEPYSIEHFAMTHFRKQPGILIFNKQTLKKLTTFSIKPSTRPLLEKTPLSKKKNIEKLSTYILIYIGVKHDLIQDLYYKNRKDEQNIRLLLAIVYILHSDESLINECMMYLMKTMRDIPTQDALLKCWKLFLTIVSLFYICDWEVQNVIRWFIVNRMFYDDILGKYARYSLICFHDRTVLGRSLDFRTTNKDIIDIPLGLQFGKKTFKCSLYSQMWDQRRKFPKLPIPLALYLVVKALIKNGVFITPKPFPILKAPTLMPRSKNSNPSKESKKEENKKEDTKPAENVQNKEEESKAKIEQVEKTTQKDEKDNNKNIKSESIINNKTSKSSNEESYDYDDDDNEEEEEGYDESDEYKQQERLNELIDESNSLYTTTTTTTADESWDKDEDEEEEEEEDDDDDDDEYDFDEDDYDESAPNSKKTRLRKSNMKILNQWSEEVFDHNDNFADGEVCNLMGFLLMWMMNLTDPIIPKSMANSFIETFAPESSTINDFSDFIDDLPLLHRNTLKFIIGFFREIAQNENYTQETYETIADNLSSYFVCTSFTTVDPFTRIKMIDIAPRFLRFCLENLDVTDVYPLNPIYEVRNEN